MKLKVTGLKFLSISLSSFLVLLASPAAATNSGWSEPVNISTPGENAVEPKLVVDQNGRAIVIWTSDVGNFSVVQSSSRPVGGIWSEPVSISSTESNSFDPQITVDSTGLVTAVWENSNDVIESRTSQSGEPWSPSEEISDPTLYTAAFPQITVDSTGLVTAVWEGFDGQDKFIQSTTKPRGGSWSEVENISPEAQLSERVKIEADAAGMVSAVWIATDEIGNFIQVSSRPRDGNWSVPDKISTASTDFTLKPELTVGSSGQAIVVWGINEGEYDLIKSSWRPSEGEWSDEVTLSLSGQDAKRPQVTVDSSGFATAIWLISDDSGTDDLVQSSTSLNGETWSVPTNLTDPGFDAGVPQVVVDATGLVTAIWRREDVNGDDDLIQTSTRARGGEWSTPTDLSAPGERSFDPQVALDSAGIATAVWTRNDLDDNDVVQTSTFTNFNSSSPSLAATGANTEWLIPVGLAAVISGSVLLAVSRRKRTA
jgi:LPXTG-motif cell wall-anchored protein